MNIIEVIEKEKRNLLSMTMDDAFDCIDEALDRIKTAVDKPRVMKRWGVDGVPKEPGKYWIVKENSAWWLANENGRVLLRHLNNKAINTQWYTESGTTPDSRLTHWLELEPTPVLPKEDA